MKKEHLDDVVRVHFLNGTRTRAVRAVPPLRRRLRARFAGDPGRRHSPGTSGRRGRPKTIGWGCFGANGRGTSHGQAIRRPPCQQPSHQVTGPRRKSCPPQPHQPELPADPRCLRRLAPEEYSWARARAVAPRPADLRFEGPSRPGESASRSITGRERPMRPSLDRSTSGRRLVRR